MEDLESLEEKIEAAYYNRNKVGIRVDLYDLVDTANVIKEDILDTINIDVSSNKVVTVNTISELQILSIANKVAYCTESRMLYRYTSNISAYIEDNSTVVTSTISGGWVEYDSYNKVFKSSPTIILDHLNQSSTIVLSVNTDFISKIDTEINNGHTHICKLFCNGFTPTFSGFTFLTDSSPLDVLTLDTTTGYYHTIVFFKLLGVNKFIILEKVLSTDVTPPSITVTVNSKTDAAITYTINTDENAELKWALYSENSTTKTQGEISAGTGAIQFGTKTLALGNNTLTINTLSELTTYDLWQYAIDNVLNSSVPEKITAQTNQSGSIQLSTPILNAITILNANSLSIPISTSSIDSNAESVSIFYKKTIDSNYTEISGIGINDTSYTLNSLSVNTQYSIYLVAKGEGITYIDSQSSNVSTSTTQNIAPTLSIPYTSTDGLIVELPFSRSMANPSTQTNLFTLSGNRSVVSVTLKSGDATKIQVTVDNAYINSDIITISITSGLVPADNGVVFIGVTNQSVTNNVQALLTYPTGYVALHSADQSVVDLSAKTVSDLSGNNRGLSLFAETTPASNGGILANGKTSILFPAGTAFKFGDFVCNPTNGYTYGVVFNKLSSYSLCGYGVTPKNFGGCVTSTQIQSGTTLTQALPEPSIGHILAVVVSMRNIAGVTTIKHYVHNLTTNTILADATKTATTTNTTRAFGIGELAFDGGIVHATWRGDQNWQHSIFYERGLNDTEFTDLCTKIVNDYKV